MIKKIWNLYRQFGLLSIFLLPNYSFGQENLREFHRLSNPDEHQIQFNLVHQNFKMDLLSSGTPATLTQTGVNLKFAYAYGWKENITVFAEAQVTNQVSNLDVQGLPGTKGVNSGLTGLLVGARSFRPIWRGTLRYGGGLLLPVVSREINKLGDTNGSMGRFSLDGFVGYSEPIWDGFWGVQMRSTIYATDQVEQNTNNTLTTKYEGGYSAVFSAYFEKVRDDWLWGVLLDSSVVAEFVNKSNRSVRDSKEKIVSWSAYFRLPMVENFEFVPKVSWLTVERIDTNFFDYESGSGFEVRVAIRASF